jgi:hypothetical protein
MIIPVKYDMRLRANIIFRISAKLKSNFINSKNCHYKKIPVIINNFNRLDFLREQINWLENAGMKKIYIIDNASTYPPLLEFYKKSKYTIFKLDKNVGHLALWKTHIFKWFENTYYIYTDPDIIPVKECPKNVVKHFKNILEKYQDFGKVGFGLKINDIPDFYPLKEKVIKWESKFWKNEIELNLYKAIIDTTFALYRPDKKGDHTLPALRTGGKYIARHLSWYTDYKNLSEEDKFYTNTATNSSSWNQELNDEGSRY